MQKWRLVRGETLFGCLDVDNIILLDYVIKNNGYHDFLRERGMVVEGSIWQVLYKMQRCYRNENICTVNSKIL